MKRNGLHTGSDGTQYWYKEWKLHREDGPAIIYTNGNQRWYKDGKLHREDGPAVIYPNGEQYWYKDGEQYEPSAHELIVYKMNEKERIAHGF